MPDASPTTRYEQVKQILDRAAAGSQADYGGSVPFWHLPLEQFLDAKVYGIRMIAPPEAPVHSCCHGPTADTAMKRRSARSGLIQGLRGHAPFDGSQFEPRSALQSPRRRHVPA